MHPQIKEIIVDKFYKIFNNVFYISKTLLKKNNRLKKHFIIYFNLINFISNSYLPLIPQKNLNYKKFKGKIKLSMQIKTYKLVNYTVFRCRSSYHIKS